MPGFFVDYRHPREACPTCRENPGGGRIFFRQRTTFASLRGTVVNEECAECYSQTRRIEAQGAMLAVGASKRAKKARLDSVRAIDATVFREEFSALCARFSKIPADTLRLAYYGAVSGRVTQEQFLRGVKACMTQCEFMPTAREIIRRSASTGP
jgi:hypothetical protein